MVKGLREEGTEVLLASLAAVDLNAWPLLDPPSRTFRRFAGEVTLRMILERFKRHQ